MEDLIRIGVIASTHGIRGEVKVYPTTDEPERFKELKDVFLQARRETIRLEIQSVKFFKNMVIVKFKGIDNINDVEKYRNCDLMISREDAVELEEDEYYFADIIGMKVMTDTGEDFGVLKDVMETGANDVYIVERKDGSEVLLPAIRECILDVDTEKQTMLVHLMKGLV
jgi:16S rRNA processing protein RimM